MSTPAHLAAGPVEGQEGEGERFNVLEHGEHSLEAIMEEVRLRIPSAARAHEDEDGDEEDGSEDGAPAGGEPAEGVVRVLRVVGLDDERSLNSKGVVHKRAVRLQASYVSVRVSPRARPVEGEAKERAAPGAAEPVEGPKLRRPDAPDSPAESRPVEGPASGWAPPRNGVYRGVQMDERARAALQRRQQRLQRRRQQEELRRKAAAAVQVE